MKKLWSCAALFALVLFAAAGAAAGEQMPAPAPTPQLESPQAEPGLLVADDSEEGKVEASHSNFCTARTTCPDGCVISCGGTSSCSRTSTSVTCDGTTHTCSGPRLCPF